MSWSQVEEVSRTGVRIGCHTVTHPRMSRLREPEIERELAGSQSAIEDRIGRAVETFAYPYGECTPAVKRAAASRFRIACGVRFAFLPRNADCVDLPRLDVYYLRSGIWFRSLKAPYGAAYVASRRWARGLRELLLDGPEPQSGDDFANSPSQ
jgi:peptidoglycan/xylan/chitin deacetylase (PgdA/CDA1 family)